MSNKTNMLAKPISTNNEKYDKDKLGDIVEFSLDKQYNETNANINGEIINLADLEKIFFLSKIDTKPDFISSLTGISQEKVNTIVNSAHFLKLQNEYYSTFTKKDSGESIEHLILRWQDLLRECFNGIRISLGLQIRESIELNRPLSIKELYLSSIEKLIKMEFSIRGIPVDLKGILHSNVDKGEKIKTKSDEELLNGINEIKNLVSDSNNTKKFNPLTDSETIEVNIIDVNEDVNNDDEE